MKTIIIWFCITFTVIVLFTSFSPYKNTGSSFKGECHYQIDEVVVGSQKYIVVTTNTGGIAICKE